MKFYKTTCTRNVRYLSLAMLMGVLLITSVFAQKVPKRVVIIGFDVFSTGGFKTARHPNLDKMIAEGVLSLTTRPVMPSVTLPNWTSHFKYDSN